MGRNWNRLLSLRWRVFGLLAVFALLLVVDAAVGVAYNARLEEQQRIAAQLRPVEEVPERLAAGLVDQQNSVRGFALTGDERLLSAYLALQEAEGRSVSRLRSRLGSEPRLLELVDNAAQGATVWHRRVAEPVIAATREGRRGEAARLVETIDEPLFNSMRRELATLSRALDERLDTSQTRAEQAGERLNRQLLLSSSLALVFLVFSGALIRRWLTRPVADLSGQVRRVADGHLREPIAGSGPAEFAELGRDIDLMRLRILDELEEARRAYEGLEQHAPLVTRLRSELITPSTQLPEGLRISARFEPAEGILAGDWVETIRLDRDRMGLILVDVSGHGPDAGLRALWLKHLLVPALNLGLGPADALHWVAGQIGDTDEWFATCVIAEVNARSGRCLYANAGHPPAFLLRARRPGRVEELPPTGPLLTDMPGARWDTEQVTLAEDDVLVLYTDGILEARDESGEEFGEERLARCLRGASGRDVDTIADEVMAQVHTFGRRRLADDATLVVATRQNLRSPHEPEPAERAQEWASPEEGRA